MEDVSDHQLKRERPNSYGHPPTTGLHHMPPAETAALHNYHQPPPGTQMPPHWNPTPSPYENGEHRPPPSDHPPHPHSYPPHYPPPPQGHVTDPAYSRHGSVSAPTRSPQSSQPHYPPPPVNGTGPEHQYYSQPQPPPEYRGRPSYGPPEGQPNGTHPPPLHVTTSHDMMPGSAQSAPSLNPFSAGPPPSTPYPWPPGYEVYPRRKPVRAAQACDPCRQRKAKCDEGRPQCTHCKDNQLTCAYRDVPPQKSEKQVLAITDELKALSGNVERMMETWKAQEDKINRILDMQEKQSLRMDAMSSNIPDDTKRSYGGSVKAERSSQSTVRQEQRMAVDNHQTSSSFVLPTLEESTPKPKATTAAAKLLSWPTIRQLIPPNQTMSYVMDTESERGLLRLYGCGEGEDKGDGHDGAPSPATSSSSGRYDEDGVSFSPNGVWGTGQFPPPSNSHPSAVREHTGGLGPNGGLLLEVDIVDKYYESYLDNIHKLHPFLDTRVLRMMVHAFKRKYSWDYRYSQQHVASSIGGKRKRETSGSPSSMDEHKNSQPISRPQARNIMQHAHIEHSVANAIILLVLALGKICSYKDPLPGPVTTSSIRTSTPYTVYSDLPSVSASAPTSPYLAPNNTNGASVTSGPNNPQGKNMDVVPGLAYFTKAADILGELPGGVDVSHVQANLLAGLYMGQLARIIPSHWYIRNACNACQVLIESTPYREKKISPARRNLINFAFWSCLQLESDILAEMEIPSSGIVLKEAAMFQEYPTELTLADPERGDKRRVTTEVRHYWHQMQLRKGLNDALKYLYDEDIGFAKPMKTVMEVLESNLENWRGVLDDFAWDDDDHQSSDLNDARLRGKYYGSKYLINRPALYWALHHASNSQTPASRHSESPMTRGHTSEYASSPAIQYNYTSHPGAGRRPTDMRPPLVRSSEPLDGWILEACQKCVHSAIRSTTVFDKVAPRLIITNIFGTAHAQFGNVLVLAATYSSTHTQLRPLVEENTLRSLMTRTIGFLQQHEAISPTLGADAKILRHAQAKLFGTSQPASFATQPISANSSFSSTR